ncbi:MAG: hypothetical protein K2Q21_06135 [Chitinophagaceae bacterium]|nr:hypothetical protein [Chitinophagaceae bacterium]
MKLNFIYSFALAIGLLSILPSNKLNAQTTPTNSYADSVKTNVEGLSFSNAVVIAETIELKGLNAESKWIKEHFSNYKLKMQTLSINDDKPYDIITILQSDGKELKLYFNIASFYGTF